jgi:hypothetical protein
VKIGRADLAGGRARCDRPGVKIGVKIRVKIATKIGVAAAVVSILSLAAAQASGARPHRLAAYAGTGTWISIYDTAAWRDPERVVARLHARHVHTLYLQTSNDRQPTAIRRPAAVGRFLDAARAAGIRVVGWYLPSFAANARDVARIAAGARFRSASGERFDSFAIDVESTKVRDIPLRSRRAVQLVAAVRRALPRPYVLGAITIDPVGARYWPQYPFRRLARQVDVFLPMAYFTARTSGARNVGLYIRRNVARVRALAGDPAFAVHPIGGEARTATLGELRAFLAASRAGGAVGVSVWEYGQMTPTEWALLARIR